MPPVPLGGVETSFQTCSPVPFYGSLLLELFFTNKGRLFTCRGGSETLVLGSRLSRPYVPSVVFFYYKGQGPPPLSSITTKEPFRCLIVNVGTLPPTNQWKSHVLLVTVKTCFTLDGVCSFFPGTRTPSGFFISRRSSHINTPLNVVVACDSLWLLFEIPLARLFR